MVKNYNKTPKIKEGWSGPGRRDEVITSFKPEYDGLHIDLKKKGYFEWWYFDARLEGGYTVVGFFRAAHERTGKTAVEIVIYKPNGERMQKFVKYKRSDMTVSREKADMNIGHNYIKVDYSSADLPIYEVFLDEDGLGFHLKFAAKVHGWMPGNGSTQFGNKGYFAWCVPFPRADVEGNIWIGKNNMPVKGIGYHDHNWGNINMPRYLEYWYWGRLYSETFTVVYAYIKCNKKMDDYAIKVLMLAKNEEIILSTGEYELIQKNFAYDAKAANKYPKSLTFKMDKQLEIYLHVQEIIDSGNILELFNINSVIRFIVKYILRLNPGYFRFNSNFKLNVTLEGKSYQEQGNILHEMVILS
ncbi:MAG: lipocalin-like domain-containing protein [Candidatus Hodarchaeota archaeon]